MQPMKDAVYRLSYLIPLSSIINIFFITKVNNFKLLCTVAIFILQHICRIQV